MTPQVVAAILSQVRPLHLGSFRATPYGLCAAAGLVLGMALVRRTARRAGLPPDAAWDTGIFAIVCCFFASRLLLIARDPRVFLSYPLLFLALPSLTLGGMALAAAATWLYLRGRELPILRTLDVFAAPLATLSALSELGHWFERSEIGMPTHVPWAVRDHLGPAVIRVHPVTLYGAGCGLGLALLLWRVLPRLPAERAAGRVAGRVAALGLAAGGAAAFLLDMLSQPLSAFDDAWIEPGQWLALGAMLSGGLLWMFAGQGDRRAGDDLGAGGPKSETLGTEIG